MDHNARSKNDIFSTLTTLSITKKGLHLETAMSQCWVYLYKNIRSLALEENPPSLSLTLCALLILFRADRLMCAPS